ncbi:uncharacterized protein BO88DRAFT_452283 [Aspergillus vadensis CBS 113365]|uniref:6-phosphogluconate dehydrogenase NADP-binding domain-containing protein n=1 Tax=Aspergillus vadensis (strain CBS 113365 / IMI 142717 / IBT 24658) TaxID=1448311 RepID=A0A319BF52_ASPVC|nr:hypothetical protein BO88DRAFT_452283 [Aspergillus vadensis CBS 113365]PYH70761.1 hypothetical protein BO88DRAFT_452283 [Aspergillus vadensis CBS 113365]
MTADTTENIAFIGLGAMGYAMAQNVRKSMPSTGRLYIFDVFCSACERLQTEMEGTGAVVVVESAREAVEQAPTVISIVPNTADIRQVYLNKENRVIAATRRTEHLILEYSTISARAIRVL